MPAQGFPDPYSSFSQGLSSGIQSGATIMQMVYQKAQAARQRSLDSFTSGIAILKDDNLNALHENAYEMTKQAWGELNPKSGEFPSYDSLGDKTTIKRISGIMDKYGDEPDLQLKALTATLAGASKSTKDKYAPYLETLKSQSLAKEREGLITGTRGTPAVQGLRGLSQGLPPLEQFRNEQLVREGKPIDLPKDEKELNITQAIAKRDALPVGSPDRKIWESYIQKLSTQSPGTTVNVGDKSIAKEIGPIMVASKQKATDAINQLDVGDRIGVALKSGNIITGPGATPRIWLAQVAQTLFPGSGDKGETLVNTRNLIRGLAQYGIAARGALKGSGQISDFESKSLIKAESGEIEDLTIPEIKAIVTVTNRAAKISLKEHKRQIENMRKSPDMAGMASFYEVPDYSNGTPPANGAGESKFDKFMK